MRSQGKFGAQESKWLLSEASRVEQKHIKTITNKYTMHTCTLYLSNRYRDELIVPLKSGVRTFRGVEYFTHYTSVKTRLLSYLFCLKVVLMFPNSGSSKKIMLILVLTLAKAAEPVCFFL